VGGSENCRLRCGEVYDALGLRWSRSADHERYGDGDGDGGRREGE